jgi:hypothetical protein
MRVIQTFSNVNSSSSSNNNNKNNNNKTNNNNNHEKNTKKRHFRLYSIKALLVKLLRTVGRPRKTSK